MSVDPHILENLSFFEGLSIEELHEFAALLNPMQVKAGDVVIEKGTPALTFYIIVSGRYDISTDQITHTQIDKQGDILGWSTVVAPFQYRGTVTAVENGELLYISSRDFIALIQNNNRLGNKIVKKINKIAEERRKLFQGE